MDELTARVERLERENHVLKRWGMVAMIAVAAIAAAAWTSPDKTVEGEKFLVKDAKGEVRAQLDAGGLLFYDEEGVARMTLAMEAGCCPCITFRTADDKPLAAFGVTADNCVLVNLRDPKGSPRLRIGVNGGGNGFYEMLDADMEPRARIGIGDDGLAKVEVLGKDGKALFEAPAK